MKIGVIYSLHREGNNSIFPLLAFKEALHNEGLEFIYIHSYKEALTTKVDFLIVSDISLSQLLKGRSTKLDLLKVLRKTQNCPVIFLSANDATGPIFPSFVEEVDLFLVKQLLKDKSIYLKPLKRHFFRDKMMNQFKFKNAGDFEPIALDKSHLPKIGVSWNLALIDWKTQSSNKLKKYFKIFTKNNSVISPEAVNPLDQRSIKIMFRGNLFPEDHDVFRLHRLLTLRVFKKFDPFTSSVANVKISPKAYLDQMKNTIISLSPFGWGEICYRDFESFKSGALLFKPDMSHIDTYPDIYKPENHISYNWDASDLEVKINRVLADPSAFQHLADRGKMDFDNAINPEISGPEFVKHFRGILEKAKENFENR
ncbi:PleD family two-component system response regulator [Indibacter alkaliphilus]|uniref:glycosyltransferase family 1 protein n=1 Tax=Indibacter alkaliphilus TaxID=579922 RepID=UPI00028237B4|nr:glycosyltransferase family 1 protein [Indibacter alkaliphilus]